MTAVRSAVYDPGTLCPRIGYPGDLVLGGESISAGAIAANAGTTWTGAAIATGIIRRTGTIVAGFTDTTATAAQIVAALKGNFDNLDVVPGSSFRLLVINTIAQALTWAGGTGVVTGTGTLDITASKAREYLVTVLNAGAEQIVQCNTTNGDATVTFVLPAGQSSLPQKGPSGIGYDIQPGMAVSGTGIAAGAYVIGVTQGVGGIVSVELSANATADGTNIAITFGPRVQFDALRQMDP